MKNIALPSSMIEMTLIQRYNTLSRENQIRLKDFWMENTGLSGTAFYSHFRNPKEEDVAICNMFFEKCCNHQIDQ